jgi:hypothetical protein
VWFAPSAFSRIASARLYSPSQRLRVSAGNSPPIIDLKVDADPPASFLKNFSKCGEALLSFWIAFNKLYQHTDTPHSLALLRAGREQPRRRAAECGQQFPPSDGNCHTPLPCEVRRGKDTTSRACSLAAQRGQDAGCFHLCPGFNYTHRQLLANAAIAASRVVRIAVRRCAVQLQLDL